MKSLGWMNEWKRPDSYPNGWDGPAVKGKDDTPPEYTACVAAGHKMVESTSRMHNCVTYMNCPICQIEFLVDSSD